MDKGKHFLLSFTMILVLLAGSNTVFVSADPLVSSFGSSGSEAGQFKDPNGITIVNDQIYVVDTFNHRVQIFDMSGTYVDQFGGSGSGIGLFSTPRGITDNGTHIFVADSGNDRIQVFDLEGAYQAEFGTPGNFPGEFDVLDGIEYHDGSLFVADDGSNDRIQEFNATTFDYIGSFGSSGSGYHGLVGPSGLDVVDNRIVVADQNNDTIKIYTRGGFKDLTVYFGRTDTQTYSMYSPDDVIVVNDHIIADKQLDALGIYNMNGELVKEISDDRISSPQFFATTDHQLYMTQLDDNVLIFNLVAQPQNVIARAGISAITVNWEITPENGLLDPTSYRIYRSGGGAYELLAETSDTYFSDVSTESGANYTYKVEAVSPLGTSPQSKSNTGTVGQQFITSISTVTEGSGSDEDSSFFSSLPAPFVALIAALVLVPVTRKLLRPSFEN